jgi:hypothetical protein
MAEGKGISKATSRSAATATAKPKAKSPIAIERETTTELASAPKGELIEQFSKVFIREAERLDEKIIKTIDRIGTDVIVLGDMFAEMQETGYHRALGFGIFGNYLKARYPKHSTTQITQAMRIVRGLTRGESPSVSKDDIREMSRDNAEGLVRMKKQGLEITPFLIEQAKTLPVHRFIGEVVEAQTLDTDKRTEPRATSQFEPQATSASQDEIPVKRTFWIAGSTSSNLDKAIEIIMYLGEGHERDRGQSKDDYIISALVGDFLASYAKDYEEMMRVRNAEAIHAARMTEDKLGPDPAEDEDDDEEDEAKSDDEGEDEDDDEDLEASGETSAIPICRHTKGDGVRCGAPSVKGSSYCFFHKKHYVESSAKSQASATVQ